MSNHNYFVKVNIEQLFIDVCIHYNKHHMKQNILVPYSV